MAQQSWIIVKWWYPSLKQWQGATERVRGVLWIGNQNLTRFNKVSHVCCYFPHFFLASALVYPEYYIPYTWERRESGPWSVARTTAGYIYRTRDLLPTPVKTPGWLKVAKWHKSYSQAHAGRAGGTWGRHRIRPKHWPGHTWPFSPHVTHPLVRSHTEKGHIPSTVFLEVTFVFSMSGSFSKEVNISEVDTIFFTDTSFSVNSFASK